MLPGEVFPYQRNATTKALADSLGPWLPRFHASLFPSPVPEDHGARYGTPQWVQARLGQGTFRVAVSSVYDGACAVTGEHTLPVLEAAHIRPYAQDGTHEVVNGLLLRSDIHRLFDSGYVTVTPDYKFEVSKQIDEEFHNGRAYYALHGGQIRLPKNKADQPSQTLLEWHNQEVFLG